MGKSFSPSSSHPCLPYGRNACENIIATALLRRAFDFVKCICKIRRVLLLSSGKNLYIIHVILSLKKSTQAKNGRAVALPAPPPPRALLLQLVVGSL